ncbi:diiron oxygenase [Streptomyces iconiensis]|uniref:Diiron oxygenase n=1 Tax=Streptomyces iconiensis TaxID=1384038 RepID=A0ABT6ZRE3_9ACTN|nr:diiron oxygenase [Streptomyces iconiensis]MDJ1131427.1 diiron oxygenase [Streptomyces iconiensis]
MTPPQDARDWYTKAGVRGTPRRQLHGELETGRLFFPPALIPYSAHPVVLALPEGRREELFARHLFQYLNFTAQFETRVVNRATERIAGGRSGLQLPPAVRLDAYRIYCDEGYHSLYSFDVIQQVSRASGFAPLDYDFAPFLEHLDGLGAQALHGDGALAQLLQVVVFETLVTSILNDVPRDGRVLTVVRDIVRDHARDEGWHHVFFSRLFRELWTGLPDSLRVRVAGCLPELVRSSLLPDLRPVRAALAAAGVPAHLVEEVVHDAYPRAGVDTGIRAAARHAVRLFDEVGVLDVPGGRDAFGAARLLPEGPAGEGRSPAPEPQEAQEAQEATGHEWEEQDG